MLLVLNAHLLCIINRNDPFAVVSTIRLDAHFHRCGYAYIMRCDAYELHKINVFRALAAFMRLVKHNESLLHAHSAQHTAHTYQESLCLVASRIIILVPFPIYVYIYVFIDDTHVALVGIFECVKYANIVLAYPTIYPSFADTLTSTSNTTPSKAKKRLHIHAHRQGRSFFVTSHRYRQHLF